MTFINLNIRDWPRDSRDSDRNPSLQSRQCHGQFPLPYLPFSHHMHYGRAMLHIKRGSDSGKQLRSFSSCPGCLLITGYNNQLPGNMETWRLPGDDYEEEEQIWINLDKVFRDAGFTLWPHVIYFMLRISEYPLSSGFGYALPSRGNLGVGSLAKLREFQYHVCKVLSVYSTLV